MTITTIEEALAFIHGRLKFGARPGLQRVQALLDLVQHPEEKLSIIHLAGTNGKGSTVAFLRNILQNHGLKVGTFTSPYIESFNERISINGKPVSDLDLIALVQKYQPLVAQLDLNQELTGITEFELITVLSFDYFLQQQVDVAIIEVGLGGLLDSTNVVSPVLTGITTIGLDHQDILGETIEEIAEQKAGIIKDHVPVVTGKIGTTALSVIEHVAQLHQAPISKYGIDYGGKLEKSADLVEYFSYYDHQGQILHLKSTLLGLHQVENATMSLRLALIYAKIKNLKLDLDLIRSAISSTFWPARMEKICLEPLILLDGAHNDHAMLRLAETIKVHFSGQKVRILFSALTRKDIAGMIKRLKTLVKTELYLTQFDYLEAVRLAELEQFVDSKTKLIADWQSSLPQLIKATGTDEILLITGSLYFTSQVRQFLKSSIKITRRITY